MYPSGCKGTVLKTVRRLSTVRGFESLHPRHKVVVRSITTLFLYTWRGVLIKMLKGLKRGLLVVLEVVIVVGCGYTMLKGDCRELKNGSYVHGRSRGKDDTDVNNA